MTPLGVLVSALPSPVMGLLPGSVRRAAYADLPPVAGLIDGARTSFEDQRLCGWCRRPTVTGGYCSERCAERALDELEPDRPEDR